MDASDPGQSTPFRRSVGMEILRSLAQLGFSLGALLAAIALAAHLARDELDALGRAVVRDLGVFGMFAGSFLADAFSFPIPPPLYIFTVIAGGGSHVAAMAAICTGSLVGGHTAFRLAARIAEVRLFAARIQIFRPKIDLLFERYGYWAIAVGSLTPVPFSVLCYLSGLYRIPSRYAAALLLLRVPRLIALYVLIRLGWAQGS